MTRKQFTAIAENFVEYAGKSVSFKMYVPWHELTGRPKYEKQTATLVGVAVSQGDCLPREMFVLRWDTGHKFHVHYRFIAYPGA